MLFRKFISQEFFDTLNSEYPDTITNKPYRSFIMYCAFGFWFKYDLNNENFLSCNQRVCATLEDKLDKLNGKNYDASKFLTRIKEDLLPEFEWNEYEYSYSNKVERTIAKVEFSDTFKQAINKENKYFLNNESNLVHYFTGNKYFRNKYLQTYGLMEKGELNKVIASVPNLSSTQIKFLDYLNNLPDNSFTKVVKNNFEDAIKVAQTIENEQSRKLHLERLLPAIYQNPKPLYAPRPNTARLFAEGPAITYLKRDVRKALTKGWIEFDIQNAHLAIIAKDWNIPELTAFLKTGNSIWKYLETYYPDVLEIKHHLKDAIYALVYGDSKDQILNGTIIDQTKKLRKENGLINNIGKEKAKIFFTIPLIKVIYEARKIQLDKLNAEVEPNSFEPKPQYDCFGKQIPFRPTPDRWARTNERSILSQKAQAVELKLLEPIIDYSKTSKYVCLIALYQFDGFSICVKQASRKKIHINSITKLLNNHIRDLGYETKVEYKEL